MYESVDDSVNKVQTKDGEEIFTLKEFQRLQKHSTKHKMWILKQNHLLRMVKTQMKLCDVQDVLQKNP
jgi:hypothetical protein